MKKSPKPEVVSSAVLRGVRTEHARAVRRTYGDRGGTATLPTATTTQPPTVAATPSQAYRKIIY